MKLAVAQIEIRAFQIDWNLKNILHNIDLAQKQGADVVIFPELAVSGYFLGDLWENKSFLEECEQAHEQIRLASENIAVVFGSVGVDWNKKNEDGRVRKYNAAYVAQNQKFMVHPRTGYSYFIKSLLPLYREFDDARYFFDGMRLSHELNLPIEHLVCPIEITVNGQIHTFGLTICEDGWPENYGASPIEILTKHHCCQTIINLSASPYSADKPRRRFENFSRLAKQHQCDIVYVNCVGMQNTGKTVFGFDGGSAVYRVDGTAIRLGEFCQDGLTLVEYEQKTFSAPGQNSTPQKATVVAPTHEKFVALQDIVARTLEQWNIKKVVVGLSGGIDSAVSACLFQSILGSKNVFLINMPSRYNSQLTQDAAKQLAGALGCAYGSVSIETSANRTKSDLNALKNTAGFETINVTNFVMENVQARDRGARLLAGVAASLGAVISCNANKTETTVGYCTLYGDAVGFLAPLADLWKFEIYELAHYFNEQVFQKEVIPKSIFEVVPSAELSAEQDVTQNKGDPIIYRYHDFLFRSWVESWEHKSLADTLKAYQDGSLAQKTGVEQKLIDELFSTPNDFIKDLERWWTAYRGMGVVKRMQMPPLVALSRRAFGTDYRESLIPQSELEHPAYKELKQKFARTNFEPRALPTPHDLSIPKSRICKST